MRGASAGRPSKGGVVDVEREEVEEEAEEEEEEDRRRWVRRARQARRATTETRGLACTVSTSTALSSTRLTSYPTPRHGVPEPRAHSWGRGAGL